MNLGMSSNFAVISPLLQFPVTMYVDYIRVYQPKGQNNVGCDPKDFPTAKYINTYMEAYTNPNLTVWSTASTGFNQTVPRNKLVDQC